MENNLVKVDGRKIRDKDSFFRKYLDAEKKPEWQFKQFFLNTIKDRFTASRYDDMYRLLRKVSKWETKYEKPVFKFTLVELKAMLHEFNSNSRLSLLVQKSNLEYYLLFAREQNMTSGILPVTIDLTLDEIREFVNPISSESKYITRDDLYDLVIYKEYIETTKNENGEELEEKIISGLVNFIDQAMPLLIFEGILGRANQDLINLEWRNIDFQNCIIKSPSGKLIQINTELSDILEKANNTNTYALNNGRTVKDNKTILRDSLEILDKYDSPYFFRPFVNSKKEEQELQVRSAVIQTRTLKAFKMYLDRPYLTLSSLYISGLIDRAIRYSIDNKLEEPMKNKEWVEYLKENDERVNLQQTYELYKEMFLKQQED